MVLGLDGLPLDLAKSLCKTGRFPNLGRLVDSTNVAEIDAELPELSPVNWTSFFTAANPGRHGIYGFTEINNASYAQYLNDSTRIACPTIFDRLGERGLKTIAVNLPASYPAQKLNGTLISGFVAPEPTKAAYPRPLAAALAAQDYLIEADTTRKADDPEHLLDQLRRTLRSREAALDLLFKDGDFDLFIFVLTETDRILHFFFPAVLNQADPLHDDFMDLLEEWDRLIGRFLDRFDALPGPKRLLALADHGFAPLVSEVDLNTLLAQKGLLSLAADTADQWDSAAMAPHKTAAFALDCGRIYINTKERFARGVFHKYIARDLCEEIKADLLALRRDGEPVIEAVHFPEEIYQGPELRNAPDLVATANPGFYLTGKFNRAEVFGLHGRFGCHSAHGAFFYDSAGAEAKRVSDVGAAVLDFFNIPVDPPFSHGS